MQNKPPALPYARSHSSTSTDMGRGRARRVLVTGGAGFLGSHVCEFLLARGDEVVCVDNLSTGRRENIEPFFSSPRFTFVQADVCLPLHVDGKIDAVAHLASPASPPDYHRLPLETLRVGSHGTENALRVAHQHKARFVLASTSEVYGDPLTHPQRETDWGNVNPVGPRSVYDEAKRFAEAITAAYGRTYGTDVGIVRIFNTFGPRMRPEDGRVVSSFITQALIGDALTIYGDGTQTRSFCYVDDLVRGIIAMLDSNEPGPVNIGNPVERTVAELAELIVDITNSASPVEYHPLPKDDPTRRRPDISRAQDRLGWSPEVDLTEALARTVEWFAGQPARLAAASTAISGPQFEGSAQLESSGRSATAVPSPNTVRAS